MVGPTQRCSARVPCLPALIPHPTVQISCADETATASRPVPIPYWMGGVYSICHDVPSQCSAREVPLMKSRPTAHPLLLERKAAEYRSLRPGDGLGTAVQLVPS